MSNLKFRQGMPNPWILNLMIRTHLTHEAVVGNAISHFSQNLELTVFAIHLLISKKRFVKMCKTLRMEKFLFYFNIDTGCLIIGYLYFLLSVPLCIYTGYIEYNDSLNIKLKKVIPLIFLLIAISSYFLIDGTVSVSNLWFWSIA